LIFAGSVWAERRCLPRDHQSILILGGVFGENNPKHLAPAIASARVYLLPTEAAQSPNEASRSYITAPEFIQVLIEGKRKFDDRCVLIPLTQFAIMHKAPQIPLIRFKTSLIREVDRLLTIAKLFDRLFDNETDFEWNDFIPLELFEFGEQFYPMIQEPRYLVPRDRLRRSHFFFHSYSLDD